MKVAELMQTNLKTISTDATVAEAVDLLAVVGVSAVPVIDRTGRAVGILTTRDILKAENACDTPQIRERLFQQTRVLEVMTRQEMVGSRGIVSHDDASGLNTFVPR